MRYPLLRLRGDDAWARRDEVGEIYRQAFDSSDEQVEGFVSKSFSNINTYAGSSLLLAMDGDTPIGMLYGYPYHPDHWWPQQVGAAIIRAGYHHYLDSALELVELAVLPHYQNKGVGSALLTQQMATQDEDYVLLSTDGDPANRATDFYIRHGFEVIVSLFRYSQSTAAAHIMGAPSKVNSTKR